MKIIMKMKNKKKIYQKYKFKELKNRNNIKTRIRRLKKEGRGSNINYKSIYRKTIVKCTEAF